MKFEGKSALPSSKYQSSINDIIEALSALPREIRWPVSKEIVKALTTDFEHDTQFWKEKITEVVETVTQEKPQLGAFKNSTLKVAYGALKTMAKMPPKVQRAIGKRHNMSELANGGLPEGHIEPSLDTNPNKIRLVFSRTRRNSGE